MAPDDTQEPVIEEPAEAASQPPEEEEPPRYITDDDLCEETPEAPHMHKTADIRITEVDGRDLPRRLVCGECGGPLGREARVVRVNQDRNEKGEMKCMSYFACSLQHARNMGTSAIVNKALSMKIEED